MPKALPLLPLVFLLSACALGGPPKPVSALLLPDRLSVTFSDNAICRARGSFVGKVTEGRLTDCPHIADFRVDATDSPKGISGALVEFFDALSLGGVISPRATVTVTTAEGRVAVFASPVPIPED